MSHGQRIENKLKHKKHYCYIITNLINNKVYIGVTCKNVAERFKEHIKVARSKGKKTTIGYAINKYGDNNFTIKILQDFNSRAKAFNAEKKYIQKYNSKNYGYNETDGGDGGPLKINLNKTIITNILTEYCNGISIQNIAINNNLSYYSVFDITRFKFSKLHDIDSELIDRVKIKKLNSKKRKKVTKEKIILIIEQFIDGNTMQTLADEHDLSINNIWSIVHRKSFKNIAIDESLEEKLNLKFLNEKYYANRKIKLALFNKINTQSEHCNGLVE